MKCKKCQKEFTSRQIVAITGLCMDCQEGNNRREIIRGSIADCISEMVADDIGSPQIADAVINIIAPMLAKDLADVTNWLQPLQKGSV